MAEELVDIVDENGNKTGVVKTRKEVHEKGLWHQTVDVWIYNSKGEVLLQKRSMGKESWPGMWDVSSSGHIPAGETPERAALRETLEELGIKVNPKDLKQLFVEKGISSPKAGRYHNHIAYVYLLKHEDLPRNLQKEEVESVVFIPLDAFEKELQNPKTAKRYVPQNYYPKLIEILRKLFAKSET